MPSVQDDGYNHADAYEDGYESGYYEGGEAKVVQLLPPYTILPDLTVDDLIALGIRHSSASLVRLLPPDEVYRAIIHALDHRLPLSVVRFGDGELLVLAHDMIISLEQANKWGPFLPYAGVTLPNPTARTWLADCIRQASIVGIPESRHPSFQKLLFPALRQLGISYHSLTLTSSTINYAMHEYGLFIRLLQGRRLLLIGNEAIALGEFFRNQGLEVVGVIAPVNGVNDVEQILERLTINDIDFDLALVAAGIAAVILCTKIATVLGKVAIDIGHLANRLLNE